MPNKRSIAVRLLFLLAIQAKVLPAVDEQPVTDVAVQLTATVNKDLPQIQLSWLRTTNANNCFVYRKGLNDTNWGAPVVLPGDAAEYLDSNVVPGAAYEYQVWRRATNYDSHAYIVSGSEVPLVEDRGKVILLVDNTLTSDLAVELARLQRDLAGDGWTVVRHDVPRMSVDPADPDPGRWLARSNEVAQIKGMVRADYLADPTRVKSLFIFGHVPVPYSGGISPDEHADHVGAWPADVFYADMEGIWTDSNVTFTNSVDLRNFNVPGDGKFDQDKPPGPVALQVGRVDLANMGILLVPEADLLRQYLNKDHNFRHKILQVPARALINDNFGVLNNEAPAVNAWANFAPLVGPSNVSTGRWLTVLPRDAYLWAYGAGAGTFSTATGVADSRHFAVFDIQVVFAMLFGSFFGDWDSANNLLRAPLADATSTLATAWAGRPYWFFHHMAMGETIGFSARLTQNNSVLYQPVKLKNGALTNGPAENNNEVHIALMGDPTLRMQTVAPPAELQVGTNDAGGVALTWQASTDDVLGYHVYQAFSANGPYTRLNDALIPDLFFSSTAVAAAPFYMVRAVRLEESPSGTYYNASQGIFAELPAPAFPASLWSGRGSRTWTIRDASGIGGTDAGWDWIKIDGTLDITASKENPFTVRIVSLTSDKTPGAPAHFDKDTGYFWPIMTASDGIRGFDQAKINLVTSEFQGDLAGGTFSLALAGDQQTIYLIFTPNHAVFARPVLISRAWDIPARVRIADLISQFTSDADGDARALIQVGSSTNGTSITIEGGDLVFNARDNFPETIEYWVQDVRPYRPGDSIRTASNFITIEPKPRGIEFGAFRAIEIEWRGEPGKRYQLQSRRENESDWINQGPPIIGTGEKSSLFERADSFTKFYRVLLID